MAAIDFPASPTVGQIFTPASGVTYRWNGTLWLATGASAGGDFCALLPGPTALPTTASVATTMPVVSGNSGGWYIPATGRFTPPAGRYLIYASMYAGGAGVASVVIIQMRKNAVVIQSSQETAQGSSWINPETQVTCDANGTDVFDMTIQSTVTGNNALQVTFSAFPISGIQGPPGVISNGFRLIERKVVSGAVATLDFTGIPSDINDLELRLDLTPVTNGTYLLLQWYDGASVLVNSGCTWTISASQSNLPVGNAPLCTNSTTAGVTSGVILNDTRATRYIGNVAGIRARATVNDIRDATRIKAIDYSSTYVSDDTICVLNCVGGGWRNPAIAISGLRLVFGAGNIASGTASLWGSP